MKPILRWRAPVLAAAAGLALVASGPAAIAGTRAMTGTAQAPGAVTGGGLTPGLGPSGPGRLISVAASSARNVWAVGLTSGPAQMWHFNGRAWSQYPFSADLYLNGVTVVSRRDAWAVGGTYWFAPTQTVAYHWNGRTWTQVATPTPDGSASFNGVAAISADNAWAVGAIGPGPGGGEAGSIPLIEHWNGRTWKRQFFPLPVNPGEFQGVTAISANNVWAVGWTRSAAPNGALIEHWNGRRWRRIPTGTPSDDGWLQGVSASSANNVWAVGFSDDTAEIHSLTLHWNGRRWTEVPSPNSALGTNLWSVAVSSKASAWAVGYTNSGGCTPECQTAALHWNGRAWKTVSSPDPPAGFLDAFLGVVAISRRDAWAVGTTDWGSTIIAHWNGRRWS